MKRFVKEYANYKMSHPVFLPSDKRNEFCVYRIKAAVRSCEKGFITIDEAMQMIADAEQYATAEAREERTV